MDNIPRSKVKFAFRRGFDEFDRMCRGSPGLHVLAGVVLLGSEGMYVSNKTCSFLVSSYFLSLWIKINTEIYLPCGWQLV